MRNEVRVIWLEDSIRGANKRPHESRFKAVKEHIESKGYQPNIKVVTNISEAKSLLTIRGGEERYDFFISDFDLGGGTDAEKGLDYLVEVRKSKNYKRFFYYILEMSILRSLKKLLKNYKMRRILIYLLIFHLYLLRQMISTRLNMLSRNLKSL